MGRVLVSGRNVDEYHRMVLGMSFFLHSREVRGLTLARLVARVGFVNDVNAALTTNNLTIRVAALERLEGGGDFHGRVGLPLPTAVGLKSGLSG